MRDYLGNRVDPLTSLFLVLPLFVLYQVGVLARMRCTEAGCTWVRNGVDFITGNVMAATGGSRFTYLLLTLAVAAALTIAILWARRRSELHPRLFVPVLIESGVYASMVGPAVVSVQQAIGMGALQGNSFLDDVISSFGAGLHEELIFRAVLFGGGTYLLKRAGLKPIMAALTAGFASSLVFSAIHHFGALGEAFTVQAFVFRFFAGVVFATIYRVRGFAIAAWTHALYDIWVFGLHRLG